MTSLGLPFAVDRLVGRVRELARVDEALRTARLVTVTGVGGVGKTRVALELARRRAARGPGEVVFVDLSAIGDAGLLPSAFTKALGLRATTSAMSEVVRYLGERNALVVVDNCEHLAEAAAAAITSLLEGCPQLRVLATSREALRIPGEAVLPLAPLLPDEAAALFVERAEAARQDAAAGAGAAIERICTRLDGLPLAIELAAARVSVLSPEAILARLGDRLDVLEADTRGTPSRQRSLRATLEWSFDLLEPDEQGGFARLSVFVGGFTVDAAEAVAGVDLRMLAGLVAKSLVVVIPGADDALRYRLLDTVRAYALELPPLRDEEDELPAAHLAFYLARAEAVHESNALGGADAEARALTDELDNLRAAVAWAAGRDPDAALRLVAASRQAWFRGGPSEGLAWATLLLGSHADPDRARALGLLCAGHLSIAHHDHDTARTHLREAAELAGRLQDDGILAAALHYLGLSGMLSRDLDAAERDIVSSIELFRSLGQDQGVGRGLGVLGLVRLYRGDPTGAARVLDEGLRAVEGCDDAWGQGQVLLALGLSAKAVGAHGAALDHLTRAVGVLGSTGDATILGVALSTVAGLTVRTNPARALRLAGAATGLRERIGGVYPPATVEELDTIRQAGANALGAAEAGRRWEEGRVLDALDAARLVEGRRPRARGGPLTTRQVEVARLVADGRTNAQIAAELHLSERTVENHIFNALRALGLHNRVQLATWVSQRELVGA